jgi:hypothetical protein
VFLLHQVCQRRHEARAQDDQHLYLEDLNGQVFVVHDEQYADHDEHHQHFQVVHQYLKFD